MTAEQKALKTKGGKEWFMVRWDTFRLNPQNIVMPCRSRMMSEHVTFDKTRADAEKRMAEFLALRDDADTAFLARTGLIERVKHMRGIQETALGQVGSMDRTDLDKIEVIEEILPRVKTADLRSEVSFAGAKQCFVAIIDDITPTGKRAIDVVVVPVESGVHDIYQKMDANRLIPDSACIRDNSVLVAEIVDRDLSKAIKESGYVSLIAQSTSNAGYTPRFDPEKFKELVAIDPDQDPVVVEPVGRFALYRNKIKDMQRKQAMDDLKARSPDIDR